MRTSPVSFGSLMVFTLNDGKPKSSIPDYMKVSFMNNPELQGYSLTDTVEFTEDKPDFTVHNAASNFSKKLDKKYKNQLPRGSKKVILTEADFYISPKTTEKKYFLTAATNEDEKKIHQALNKTLVFYAAKFGDKA